MQHVRLSRGFLPGLFILLSQVVPATAADLKILLPLNRVAYQTNEWIDVSVLRSSPNGLKEGRLALVLTGEDGSKIDFTFAVRGAGGVPAVATENLHINGSLLRPEKYAVDAAIDGAVAPTARIEVYTHLRKTSFKLIDWGSRAAGPEQSVLGEESMGLNLNLPAYGGFAPDEMIRGGLDYMWCCTMSGGAQMDLRQECDWSDPYVLGGGVARVSRRAFMDRVYPNCLGVHIYDEPTLTTWKHTATGEKTPFNVPAQDRSFKAAFGENPLQYNQVKLEDPQDTAKWKQMQLWRLSLLDAAWKLSAYSIKQARPDFLSANQGSWLFSGYGAGYYFNDMNSLPVYSGHGGYDYLNGGDFAPSYFFEFGRFRQTGKPNWYLPMWGSGHGDLFRAEQYLSFQNNLQGLAKPPDLLLHRPSTATSAGAMVESNKAMGRLGTIFTTMPVTAPGVAVLFSLSHNLNAEVHNMKDTYVGDNQFHQLLYVYMASKILHMPFSPVVEEDILDGSLAAHHRVLVIAGNNSLEPTVIAALEAFIANGGAVLLSDDSQVKINGARPFKLPQEGVALNKNMETWGGSGQWDKWNGAVVSSDFFKIAVPIAEAMRPALTAAGVKPVFGCDQPGIVGSRQAQGDIEYLFAVNATPDYDTYGWYFLHNAVAAINLEDDGRPVYDAMNGGLIPQFHKAGGSLSGQFRFGPGQMRVFARTVRPIGGVQVFTPLVTTDFTRSGDTSGAGPIHLDIGAVLVDDQKQVLCGAAPLRIEVIDPLKSTRYDLYRATDRGMFRMSLPLGANDPAGDWTVVIHELLNNTLSRATFHYTPPAQCGAMAGETHRAVMFGQDRENIFRFFRTHKAVTIVKGTTDVNNAQADRLVEILKPWDVQCKIMTAADAAKPRELTPELAATWVGLGGREPDVSVAGPVILLGSPDDNILIKQLLERNFLPYKPVKDQFPGRGRGMIAWQADGIRYFNGETITLIGYDAAGLAEAVGTMYEVMAGQDPITPLALPAASSVTPAVRDPAALSSMVTAWKASLPDRVVAMKTLPGSQLLVLSDDGTLSLLRGGGLPPNTDRDLAHTRGGVIWQKSFTGGEHWALDASRDGSLIVLGASRQVIGLDRAGRQLFDVPLPGEKIGPWITFVAVSPDGKKIAAGGGFSDWRGPAGWRWRGTLLMLSPQGKPLWQASGPDPKDSKKELLPDATSTGLFSADGSRLVLPVGKETRILDAETGKLISMLPLEAGGAAPVRLDNGAVLLPNGTHQLARFSPGDGAAGTGWELDVPDGVKIVTADLSAAGPVVGTEGDGAVRLLSGPGGGKRKAAWEFAFPTRIVKKVAASGDSIAVAYWGGTLRVLDLTGHVRYGQALPQDISTLDWAGGDLVIGLADGQVIALATERAAGLPAAITGR